MNQLHVVAIYDEQSSRLQVTFETATSKHDDNCFDITFLRTMSPGDKRWEDEGILVKCLHTYPCVPLVTIHRLENEEIDERKFSLDKFIRLNNKQDERFYSWRDITEMLKPR